MKCPNCSAEIFEGDKFCGECGYALAGKSEATIHTASESGSNSATYNNEETAYADAPHAADHQAGGGPSYFSEVLSFFKAALLSPGRTIGSSFNIGVTSGTVGLLILLASLLTFIQMRVAMGELFITFSTLFEMLIVLAIMVAVFFGVTYLLLAIVIRQNQHWHRVFNDYAVTMVITISFFILAALLNLVTLYELGIIAGLIGFLLFITTPIYLMLRYAENNNVKFDSFYAIIIYFVLVAIVFYLIIRIFMITFFANFLYDIERMMMF
ncbi:zinc ribbon domain-containing protein [Salinicoccus kekensis]|uniref:Zinc ribbon protein n=1 Tax=Salinicoccus kekensis TaxID=714307 RepID=A0A285UBG2_9STAP|nr:zinc ribbon domain-containing protein [Salinicoccus kekensis]SOC37651.1 hypothetical protein SAMN05878391_0041 [Salinicoccus kekensis]